MSNRPARLHKNNVHEDFSFMDKVEALAIRHAPLLFILAIVILLALFVTLIFVITGVSATESGVQYNQFDKII